MSLAQEITRKRGGDWRGDQGLIPGPGHSAADRSLAIVDADDSNDVILHSFAGDDVFAIKDEWRKLGWLPDRPKKADAQSDDRPRVVASYKYTDQHGATLFTIERIEPGRGGRAKDFVARQPNGKAGMGGVKPVPYNLPDIAGVADIADWHNQPVFVCEGERKADTLGAWGLVATCNPFGAGKWPVDFGKWFAGRDVIILPDTDDVGRKHAIDVACKLHGTAASVRMLELPGLPPKGDVVDWVQAGGTHDQFAELVAGVMATPAWEPSDTGAIGNDTSEPVQPGVTYADFLAHLPSGQFIFTPTREFWPAGSVNAVLPRVDGKKAHEWLSGNRPVHQVAWIPGAGEIIHDRLTDNGGWTPHPGARCYNLYQPPIDLGGDATKAGPWLDLVARVYPKEAGHLYDWFAHRVQQPGNKCNHAVLLGGDQGIGKDTMLEPIKDAIGPWNFQDIGPGAAMGRFNGFLKSVILRISEARDLGDHDRFAFYDKSKTWIAAPPDVHRIDEKNRQEYAAFNVCGVVITTNRLDAVHLEPDDRRHFVAWSDLTKEDFKADYWAEFWGWLDAGGRGHVQAFLRARDLSRFNPKAPPPKTEAFRAILTAARPPEAGEAADALELLGWPDAVTIAGLNSAASVEFSCWLNDRRNRRTIPHRLADVGYVQRANPATTDGRWKIAGTNTTIYVKRLLDDQGRLAAIRALIEGRRA
mgnify:CR=1 FL=1